MRQPRHGPAAVSRNRTPLGKRYTLEIFPSCFRFDRRAIVRLTVVLLLIVLCCWPTEVVNGSRVQVDPQIKAYEGLVVAISPKIKQNHGKSIISNLEVSNLLNGRANCIGEILISAKKVVILILVQTNLRLISCKNLAKCKMPKKKSWEHIFMPRIVCTIRSQEHLIR